MASDENPFLESLPLTEECVKEQAKMASDTPRTDALEDKHEADFLPIIDWYRNAIEETRKHARELERELAECKALIGSARDRLPEEPIVSFFPIDDRQGMHWVAKEDYDRLRAMLIADRAGMIGGEAAGQTVGKG